MINLHCFQVMFWWTIKQMLNCMASLWILNKWQRGKCLLLSISGASSKFSSLLSKAATKSRRQKLMEIQIVICQLTALVPQVSAATWYISQFNSLYIDSSQLSRTSWEAFYLTWVRKIAQGQISRFATFQRVLISFNSETLDSNST